MQSIWIRPWKGDYLGPGQCAAMCWGLSLFIRNYNSLGSAVIHLAAQKTHKKEKEKKLRLQSYTTGLSKETHWEFTKQRHLASQNLYNRRLIICKPLGHVQSWKIRMQIYIFFFIFYFIVWGRGCLLYSALVFYCNKVNVTIASTVRPQQCMECVY